jgi:hypothetical protein
VNGDKYVGNFYDGKRTGTGSYYWRSGEVLHASFKDDVILFS